MPGRSQTSSPRRSSRMALRRRARRSLVGFTATDITQPDELLRRWTWPRFPRPAWSRSMRRIRRPGPAAAFGSPGKAARPLLTSRSSSGRISPAHWRLTPGIWILLLARLPYGTRYSVEVSAPGPLACKVLKNAYLNGETITRWHRDDAGSSFAAPPATGSRCQSTPTALHTGHARTAGQDGLAASWPAPSRTRRSRSEATTGIIGQTRLAAEDRRRDVAALSGC